MGSIYKLEGNLPEALKKELDALKIFEEEKDEDGISTMYNNIGNVYAEQSNDSVAISYYRKSYEIAVKRKEKYGIAGTNMNMGGCYLNERKYDSALIVFNECLKVLLETNDRFDLGSIYGNIGAAYDGMGKHDEGLKYQFMSLKSQKEIDNKRGVGFAYCSLGEEFYNQKKYPLAKLYYDSALTIAKAVGAKSQAEAVYKDYAILDSSMGDYTGAFEKYKNYIAYRDSIKNEANTKKIVQEQMQYDFDKKQAEENAIQEKKDADTAAEKKRQEIITGSVGGGLVLVLIFSGLLFSRFRVTQKQKQIIEHQKAIVEEKNKEVLDSITYAKRLQDAILPPISVIKKHLPDSFILYKPKDIVAGDFYWLERVGDTIFVAAADCTGHGVPGAMVSVVCSNALNRAVKEFKITEPGKILDKVRELVLETFEKSEGEIKDGMDISLLAIGRQPLANSSIMQWAGAYNSLWYFENGEMREVNADKQPIGKTDNPKPFTTYTLTLNPPSEGREAGVLYLFTDGYADQFGGAKGKKFKYKQLQQLIADNAHLPMEEQGKILNEALETWRGNLEQVDDVLIIGIRV